jgi:hypothetical protein
LGFCARARVYQWRESMAIGSECVRSPRSFFLRLFFLLDAALA